MAYTNGTTNGESSAPPATTLHINGHGPPAGERQSFNVKAGLAKMLKGGVILDVMNVEQAILAEKAGACAVMALERVPSKIRAEGGVARMSDPQMIKEIMAAVSIPVMAKVRIGHLAEAKIIEALGVDYIDESEVLTPADPSEHINKHEYNVPFVCGCKDLGEALRRIAEGAAMIRTKGEAGTGNIIAATEHTKKVSQQCRYLTVLTDSELYTYAKEIRAPIELVRQVAKLGRLPVVNFAAGGVATPADAALCMMLGCDGVFVGSGVFDSSNPEAYARAIVEAVTHYNDPVKLAEISTGLGAGMKGENDLKREGLTKMSERGY